MPVRRFPPPWSAELTPNCFVVRDVLFVATRVAAREIIGRLPARSQLTARLRNALDQATLFEVVRCAMTISQRPIA
jgi:hypothetical protein